MAYDLWNFYGDFFSTTVFLRRHRLPYATIFKSGIFDDIIATLSDKFGKANLVSGKAKYQGGLSQK